MAFNRGKIGEALAADYTTRPSYFVAELDGVTAPTAEIAYEWEDQRLQYQEENAAENGWLRAAETNDRYAWEEEQDRQREAAFGAAFDAWQDSIWCPR